jgi:hypothetical protein
MPVHLFTSDLAEAVPVVVTTFALVYAGFGIHWIYSLLKKALS